MLGADIECGFRNATIAPTPAGVARIVDVGDAFLNVCAQVLD